jgi:hypothetical protein
MGKEWFIYFDEFGNIFQSYRQPTVTEIEEWENGVLDILKITFNEQEKVFDIERIDGTEIEEKEIIEQEEEQEEKEVDFEQEQEEKEDGEKEKD